MVRVGVGIGVIVSRQFKAMGGRLGKLQSNRHLYALELLYLDLDTIIQGWRRVVWIG